MALSGSFQSNVVTKITSDQVPRYIVVTWQAEQSIENNTSTISYTVTAGGTNPDKMVIARAIDVVIAGTTVYHVGSGWGDRFQLFSQTVMASGTLVVEHDDNGEKTIDVSIGAALYYEYVNSTYSGTITLDTIPRKAIVRSATSFTDESNPTITYTNGLGEDVTSLHACISLTSANDDIAYREISKTGTSYTFYLTEAEREILRNATSGNSRSVYFMIKTIVRDAVYYSTSSPQTLTIINANPSFPEDSVSYADTNDLIVSATNNNQIIVQNKSNLAITYLPAEAKKGATISKYIFSLNGNTITSSLNGGTIDIGTIDAKSDLTLAVTAIDSRGNSSDVIYKTITVCEYYTPSILSFNVYRSNDNEEPDVNGTYLKCSYVADVAPVNGTNRTTVTAYYNSDSQDDVDGVLFIDLDGDKDTTYNVYLKITDAYGGSDTSSVMSVLGGTRILNITKDGTGFAIGKMADSNNLFECRWDAKFNNSIDCAGITINQKTIFDLIYPVGSIYMSVNAVDPADIFGGVWERIQDTFLLAAGSSYLAGETGGEATHTLTVDEIPEHTHNITGTGSAYSAYKDVPDPARTIMDGSGSEGATAKVYWSWKDNTKSYTVGLTGSGAEHNNMPPYLAVFVWKRVG